MELQAIPQNEIFMILALAIVAWFAWNRWLDRRWIERRFGEDRILARSFGVASFGLASQPGPPRRARGFLLLLPGRLFFHSRRSGQVVDIQGHRIRSVYPDHSHKGVYLNQSVVIIDFTTAAGDRDSAAFRVPYPPQWIRAIEKHLMTDQEKSKSQI